jgi:hypothetical protein
LRLQKDGETVLQYPAATVDPKQNAPVKLTLTRWWQERSSFDRLTLADVLLFDFVAGFRQPTPRRSSPAGPAAVRCLSHQLPDL